MSTNLPNSTPKRCAIYTRKSSEEGLDQAFNSLDAQWQAGAAYIESQKHQGWQLVKERFDDGGYSGGHIERPGLQRLMAAVEQNKVDIIVVYKIDRLTRSINDFAHLVRILDAHNVSFVSVTQPLNTTDSMGRLTLHMLLSFAQFEREITSERIRDKIAESKKRGLWMGGPTPLGYDVCDRTLKINPKERKVVQQIYRTFVKTRSISETCYRINQMGLRTKVFPREEGGTRGGLPFSKGQIRKILRNRLYLGLIHHQGTWYPGQHPPLLEKTLWDEVCSIFNSKRGRQYAEARRWNTSAFLRGLLFAPDGHALTPTHCRRRGKRYRYYTASSRLRGTAPYRVIQPLPADTIEELVMREVAELLQQTALLTAWSGFHSDSFNAFETLKKIWPSLIITEQQRITRLLIARIDVTETYLSFQFCPEGLMIIAGELKE